MKVSIKQLQDQEGQVQYFQESLDVQASLMAREPEILAASAADLSGSLVYISHSVIADFVCRVELTLPSSRSLSPVPIQLEIPIRERYVLPSHLNQDFGPDELIMPLEGDWLDIQPAVEDHILLSIPLQVLSPEELSQAQFPSGRDWEVVSQDELERRRQAQKDETLDPRFAALQDFFNQEDSPQA